jgi:hypothetical protein
MLAREGRISMSDMRLSCREFRIGRLSDIFVGKIQLAVV